MKVGYAYVVGDIIHKGHLQHLKNCRAMCDILITGVLTDKATMEKKPKPIIGLSERFDIIDSLKFVNVTVAQDTYSPMPNIHALKPDILFESTSHKKPGINPYGIVKTMPYFPIQSSTKIKKVICDKS